MRQADPSAQLLIVADEDMDVSIAAKFVYLGSG